MSNGEQGTAERTLAGKTALVTGASSGIGKAVALRLAGQGASLFLAARREGLLAEVAREVAALGVSVGHMAGDVTDEAFAERAVSGAQELGGGIDILVLAAGQALMKPFPSTTTAEFRALMDVNALGMVHFCRAAIRRMRAHGSMVLIGSPAGSHGARGMTAYALSKGGLVAFAKSLALELASRRIRVNVVSPGYVKTELTDRLYGGLTEAQGGRIAAAYPLGIGSLDDVAAAVAFLVSSQASWITGVVLPVDGGFSAGQ